MRLTLALAVILATPAAATPMWEQADRWRCSLEHHMRVASGAPAIEMDPNGAGFEIDFAVGTLSSAFVDGVAPIVKRSYHGSQGVGQNILIAAWDIGEYPVVIQESDGRFWQIAGSGTLEQGDEVWMAMYRCAPDLVDS